jgi:PTS system mannose-specific IIC component
VILESWQVMALLAWGTLAGLDLASGPQVMITRPLVAGSVAGALAGDATTGLVVGAILELFALEVLPVGAVRYPDYGPAAVGAAVTAAGSPGVLGVGLGVTVGLVLAVAGEFSIPAVRRRNSLMVRRRAAALDSGDPAAIAAVHWHGIALDAARALGLTVAGLLVAYAVRRWFPHSIRGAVILTTVMIGAGLSSSVGGMLRLAGGLGGVRWIAIGLAGGVAWVVLE